jgi:hypothetical protein
MKLKIRLGVPVVDAMFEGAVVQEVPSFGNRYKMKKHSGSSDTHTERDEFE